MQRKRVSALIDAYENRTLEEYTNIVTNISKDGGLTPEEVSFLQTQLLSADAWIIVRHAGVRPAAAQAS